VEVVLTSQGDS